MANLAIDVMWDDNPVDVTAEANFIWSIANILRGSYMPDKYGDVIIPMTIIRRFERAGNGAAYQQNGQGWMLIFGNQSIFRTGFKPQNL